MPTSVGRQPYVRSSKFCYVRKCEAPRTYKRTALATCTSHTIMRKKMATTRNTTGVFTPWQEKHAYLYRDLVLNKQRCVFCVHSPIEQKHGSTAQSKGREKDCAHIHYVGTICQGCTEDIDVVRGPYLARLTSNVGNERHMTRPLATEKHAIASSKARSRTNGGLPPNWGTAAARRAPWAAPTWWVVDGEREEKIETTSSVECASVHTLDRGRGNTRTHTN